MKSHDHLIERLINASQQGEDILPILQAERDHLAHCVKCRERITHLISAIFNGDILFLAFAYLEDLSRLEEPPHYPRFDLSFLTSSAKPGQLAQPPQSGVWRTVALPSSEGAERRVRQLAEGVELRIRVYKNRMNASFEGLTGWLSSSVMSARAPVVEPVWRGGEKRRVGKGQVLSLPDPEGNLEITLAVQAAHQGKSHLRIEVYEAQSERPLDRVRINLRHSEGSQAIHTRAGKAIFYELDPDQYTIEVKPSEKGEVKEEWHFDITLESI